MTEKIAQEELQERKNALLRLLGSLLNPLLLFLSFLSMLFIIPPSFVSMALAVIAIWPWQ
jgi:hypothetical protein